jgi:hypothetical protein
MREMINSVADFVVGRRADYQSLPTLPIACGWLLGRKCFPPLGGKQTCYQAAHPRQRVLELASSRSKGSGISVQIRCPGEARWRVKAPHEG